MLVAVARVATDRSDRYLVQLCRHVSLVARKHSGMRAAAEWSGNRGVINLGRAQCRLHAVPGALLLRAEAPDDVSLRELERRVADRVAQVGRRDRLAVSWTHLQGAEEHTTDTTEGHGDG